MAEAPLYLTFRAPQRVADIRNKPNTPSATSTVPDYPYSWYFDFVVGDFVQSGGMVVEVDGDLALVQWCVKTVLTERYAWPVYDRKHGTTLDTLVGRASREEIEATAPHDIRDALMKNDNRVRDVSEFAFEWIGDAVTIWCTVYSVRGGTFRLPLHLGDVSATFPTTPLAPLPTPSPSWRLDVIDGLTLDVVDGLWLDLLEFGIHGGDGWMLDRFHSLTMEQVQAINLEEMLAEPDTAVTLASIDDMPLDDVDEMRLDRLEFGVGGGEGWRLDRFETELTMDQVEAIELEEMD